MKRLQYERVAGVYRLTADEEWRGETGAFKPWSDPAGNFAILPRSITLRAGFVWDGPSGPTIDTEDAMRCSAYHDALYRAIRRSHGIVPRTARARADRILRMTFREDQDNTTWPKRALHFCRRWAWWACVRAVGWRSARPEGA